MFCLLLGKCLYKNYLQDIPTRYIKNLTDGYCSKMTGKRKSEATISAAQEEKKPKDSQSITVHSSGATSL